ncbi:hypothetical protein Tco_0418094 [Tanacetum coccineum]
MTGKKSLLSTYKAYDGGNVVFGSNLKGKIIGKVIIEHWAKDRENDVYAVYDTLVNHQEKHVFSQYSVSKDPILCIGQYSVSEDPILRIGQSSVSEDPILRIGQYSVSEDPILRIGQYFVSEEPILRIGQYAVSKNRILRIETSSRKFWNILFMEPTPSNPDTLYWILIRRIDQFSESINTKP